MSFNPFTDAELKAIKEVQQHQHSFSPTAPQSELQIALDGHGSKEIDRQITPSGGGNLTATMIQAASSPTGCRIIHNHPSQGSLSSSDWNALACYHGMEMTAVNSQGTTFRGKVIKPSAFINWYQDIQSAYDSISMEFHKQIGVWYSQQNNHLGDFALDNDWLVGKAICEQLASKGYVEFECNLKGSDSTAMLSPQTPTIVTHLETWCSQAIP